MQEILRSLESFTICILLKQNHGVIIYDLICLTFGLLINHHIIDFRWSISFSLISMLIFQNLRTDTSALWSCNHVVSECKNILNTTWVSICYLKLVSVEMTIDLIEQDFDCAVNICIDGITKIRTSTSEDRLYVSGMIIMRILSPLSECHSQLTFQTNDHFQIKSSSNLSGMK
jgi:hypothetical protein